jgi:hypothetical protein
MKRNLEKVKFFTESDKKEFDDFLISIGSQDGYMDEGTIKIVTNEEIYCIDSRIGTTTKGSIFFNYPKDDNSNIVSDQDGLSINANGCVYETLQHRSK